MNSPCIVAHPEDANPHLSQQDITRGYFIYHIHKAQPATGPPHPCSEVDIISGAKAAQSRNSIKHLVQLDVLLDSAQGRIIEQAVGVCRIPRSYNIILSTFWRSVNTHRFPLASFFICFCGENLQMMGMLRLLLLGFHSVTTGWIF